MGKGILGGLEPLHPSTLWIGKELQKWEPLHNRYNNDKGGNVIRNKGWQFTLWWNWEQMGQGRNGWDYGGPWTMISQAPMVYGVMAHGPTVLIAPKDQFEKTLE